MAEPFASKQIRILGIDPGLNHTGFGVIDVTGDSTVFVTAGCIHVPKGELSARLGFIHEQLARIVEETHPSQAAAEIIFLNTNPKTTLLLGQARGAALACLASKGLRVEEFSATNIKNSIVGTGRASKLQVQSMVARLLQLNTVLQPDAADALACALTCAHSMKMQQLTAATAQRPAKSAGRVHGSCRTAWEKFIQTREKP